jgi:hypothetical protein
MNCPECGSSETKRLQVVYEEGTSNIRGSALVAEGKGLGIAPIQGYSQTKLAKLAEPPGESPTQLWIAMFFVSLLWCLGKFIPGFFGFETAEWKDLLEKAYANGFVFTVGIIGGIFCAFKLIKGMIYNRTKFPDLNKAWLKKWMCMKCGKIFENK